jgi:hypothetical protein
MKLFKRSLKEREEKGYCSIVYHCKYRYCNILDIFKYMYLVQKYDFSTTALVCMIFNWIGTYKDISHNGYKGGGVLGSAPPTPVPAYFLWDSSQNKTYFVIWPHKTAIGKQLLWFNVAGNYQISWLSCKTILTSPITVVDVNFCQFLQSFLHSGLTRNGTYVLYLV